MLLSPSLEDDIEKYRDTSNDTSPKNASLDFSGAIFQIVCIAAAIWLPAKEGEVEEVPQKGGPTAPPRHKGKHNEKKKRR